MALFHYFAIRAFAHETEDPERVRAALRNVAHADVPEFEETIVDGSHGNRVRILETSVKSAKAERALFADLRRDDPVASARLVDEAPRRLDENLNFHLRLDKQEAYLGRMVLAQGDDAVTVRAKVRSFPAKGSDPYPLALADVRSFLGP